MLEVKKQLKIQQMHEKEGKSLRAIAEELGISVPTAEKYANKEDFNVDNEPRKRTPHYPKLGPFIPVIDGWLEGDLKAWRKQRHTAQRIYERLCEEHGFDGSYSTVRRYVMKKKAQMVADFKAADQRTAVAIKKGCIARIQDPGVAEADFCEVEFYDDAGEKHRAFAFVISFVYSNRGLLQICPSNNQQCFMQCLQDSFEHFGGVPERIRIDNACTAVIPRSHKPGKEPTLTDAFMRFKMHHRFEVDVCNLNAGNEKGNVENHCGAFRRALLVPLPTITSFAEFNKELMERCDRCAEKVHYRRHKPIIELWEEDRAKLLNLPKYRYEVFRLATVTVDNCGYVKFETNRYGLCPDLNGLMVTAKVYRDYIEFFLDQTKLASYQRLYGRDKELCQWQVYLPTLLCKPGALEHSRFYDSMPMLARNFLTRLQGQERKKGIKLLMEMVAEGGPELCIQVLELAAEKGRWNPDNVRQIFCFLAKKDETPEPMKLETPGPALNYEPDLTAYDQLARGFAHA